MISELAFSHNNSNTLACVDEGGNVYVWTISEQDGNLEYPLNNLLIYRVKLIINNKVNIKGNWPL